MRPQSQSRVQHAAGSASTIGKLFRALALGALAFSLASCGSGGGGGASTPPPSSAKAITTYSINGTVGTINEPGKTITVALPSGSTVTALVATFTTTGASVTVNSTPQVSGTTANDFTNPVVYTVTAVDGTSVNYTVTITFVTTTTLCNTTCTGGIQTNYYRVGTGTCFAGTTQLCAPYVCGATACLTSCTTDANCTSGYWCSGTSCVAKKATGQTCSASSECTSGFCADGYCCNTVCNGPCVACNTPGSVGTCANQPMGFACGTSCTSGTQTNLGCNGSGSCTLSMSTASCNPYICGATACLSSCTVDADCATGFLCSGGLCQ